MATSIERCRRRLPGATLTLVALNVLVFVGLRLTAAFAGEAGATDAMAMLGLPSSLSELAVRPYTILTYMFTQYDQLHAIMNILWLVWFGTLASEEKMRGLTTGAVYVGGGVVAGACYLALMTLNGEPGSMLVGSSAAVMSLAVAVTCLNPRKRVEIPLFPAMPLYVPVAVIAIIETLWVASGSPEGHVAHLGGMLFGAAAGMMMRMRRRTPRHSENVGQRENRDIDRVVIEKIITSGYSSLTESERRHLEGKATDEKAGVINESEL